MPPDLLENVPDLRTLIASGKLSCMHKPQVDLILGGQISGTLPLFDNSKMLNNIDFSNNVISGALFVQPIFGIDEECGRYHSNQRFQLGASHRVFDEQFKAFWNHTFCECPTRDDLCPRL